MEQEFWLDIGLKLLAAFVPIILTAIAGRKGWKWWAAHLVAKIAFKAVEEVAESWVDKVKELNLAQTGNHKLQPQQIEEAKAMAKNEILFEAIKLDHTPGIRPSIVEAVVQAEKIEAVIEKAVEKLAVRRSGKGAGARG